MLVIILVGTDKHLTNEGNLGYLEKTRISIKHIFKIKTTFFRYKIAGFNNR